MNIFTDISEIVSLGNIPVNSLVKADCLEAMNYIPDKSIDMVMCDLPYGTTLAPWDSIIDLPELWKHYERIIKDNGAIVLTAQTPFDKVLGLSNLKLLRYEWIWEKTQATGFLNAEKMPMKSHENVLVFYKNLPTYHPQKTTGHKPVNNFTKKIKSQNKTELYGEMKQEIKGGEETDRYPRSVLLFPTDKQKEYLHSTQKPLSLMGYFINTYTNEGDFVLDNCCGSGSTGVAALKLKRNFIMIEKDEVIFNVAANRLQQLHDKPELF